jgi:hypothetical protein
MPWSKHVQNTGVFGWCSSNFDDVLFSCKNSAYLYADCIFQLRIEMTALKYDVAAGETKDRRVDVLAFGVRTYVRRFALKAAAAGVRPRRR